MPGNEVVHFFGINNRFAESVNAVVGFVGYDDFGHFALSKFGCHYFIAEGLFLSHGSVFLFDFFMYSMLAKIRVILAQFDTTGGCSSVFGRYVTGGARCFCALENDLNAVAFCLSHAS